MWFHTAPSILGPDLQSDGYILEMLQHDTRLNSSTASESWSSMADRRAAVLAESASDGVPTGGRGCVGASGTGDMKIGIFHENVARVSCAWGALTILRNNSITYKMKMEQHEQCNGKQLGYHVQSQRRRWLLRTSKILWWSFLIYFEVYNVFQNPERFWGSTVRDTANLYTIPNTKFPVVLRGALRSDLHASNRDLGFINTFNAFVCSHLPPGFCTEVLEPSD